MATAGKDARVLFAQYDLSNQLDNADVSRDIDLEDSTTFGDSAHEFTVTLKNGTINFSGIYSATAGQSDPVLSAALATAAGQPISVFPAGYGTVGNRASISVTRAQNYALGAPVAGIVKFSYAAQADGGIDGGVVLHAFAVETGTTASASVDNGAASTNGLVANVHASAFTGTSVTPKIQHSTDDSVWVDLVSFTAISGATSEQVVVAAGTTVNRYLRETRTGTFTSVTMGVVAARR